MDSGWFVDPQGKFDGRFFDGTAWTNKVSDNGVLRIDDAWEAVIDLTTTTPTSSRRLERTYVGYERRRGGERRQVELVIDLDLRSRDRRASF